jgi:phospholipase/lecithinase/hemolysin
MRTNKKTYAPEWKHNPKITKAKAEAARFNNDLKENLAKVRIKKKKWKD